MAHQTSGSDCDALYETYLRAFAEAVLKSWEAYKAWKEWQDAEGTWDRLKKRANFYRKGHAAQQAWKRVEKAITHHNEHCN
ncbi:MAG: hypothetical protein OXN17_07820 [Candidatus Poribacteria bacterium]|nr:hypothetical protein [Candidatus Poribacteria bacterium]MDE0504414.1 hypothetical protein [Candidatus Poribacteria bacterium]